GKAVGGHAVLAAEVAAIHHREAQVADQATVAVAKGLPPRHPASASSAAPFSVAERHRSRRRSHSVARRPPTAPTARTPRSVSSTGTPATCPDTGVKRANGSITEPAPPRDRGPRRGFGP